MIKINLKRLLSILSLSMLMFMNAAAAKSDTGEALESIYQMQVNAYAVLGDYYMFSGLEGDTRYAREMQAGIKRFDDLVGELTKNGNPAAKLENLANVITQWQEFKKLLDINKQDILTQGFANVNYVGKMGNTAIALNTSLSTLYSGLIESQNFKVAKQLENTRHMALIIQGITAEYAARTTSTLGQVTEVVAINEGGMPGQSKVFAALLVKLKAGAKSDKRIYKLVDQIGVKWDFIFKSVSNYNEQAVPFIVSTYGDRISQNLQTVGEHFSTKRQAKK